MTDPFLSTLGRVKPQSEPLDDRQVRNDAGGFVYETSTMDAVRRFLTIGTTGGTFYVGERVHTERAIDILREAVSTHGLDPLSEAIAISQAGRARSNDPAIFLLALYLSNPELENRRAAREAAPQICRIPTHWFTLFAYYKALRAAEGKTGLSKVAADTFRRYFQETDVDTLALHAVKYQSRTIGGHTIGLFDLMRVCHPRAGGEARQAVFDHISGTDPRSEPPRVIAGVDSIATGAITPSEAVKLGVPWEALPSEALNDPAVQMELIRRMPGGALLRNLARFTRGEALKPLSEAEAILAGRLRDEELIRKARLHPFGILDALRVYATGGRLGLSRGAEFTPNQEVLDALDEAMEISFGTVEPSGKRHFFGIDVSGSMGAAISGSQVTNCRDAAAAVALAAVKSEPRALTMGFSHHLVDLGITRRNSFRDVQQKMLGIPFGWTDCALPMVYARQEGLEVDVFTILTDSETWYGDIHPMQALKDYRKSSGIDARLIVVAMTGTSRTIADPADPLTLDVSGFDASVVSMLTSFARGDF